MTGIEEDSAKRAVRKPILSARADRVVCAPNEAVSNSMTKDSAVVYHFLSLLPITTPRPAVPVPNTPKRENARQRENKGTMLLLPIHSTKESDSTSEA
jgi:hypothetical protein